MRRRFIALLVGVGIGLLAGGGRILGGEASLMDVPPVLGDDSVVDVHALPAGVVALRKQIRGKKPSEVAAMLVQKFGRPKPALEDWDGGFEWDVDGGELRVWDETAYLVFYDSHGNQTWLSETQNPVGDNIVGCYKMVASDSLQQWGTGLGDLEIRSNGTYEFFRRADDPAAAANFFGKHPRGRYTVAYPADLSAGSLLEKLPSGACAVMIHFSADRKPGDKQPAVSLDLTLCAFAGHWRILMPAVQIGQKYSLQSQWRNTWGNQYFVDWDYSFGDPVKEELN